MAMLPRYERLGVKAAQPAQLDFANFREQSQAAQTLSQSLGRMSDFAFGVAEEKFGQVAKQTVSNLGATETLARIQKSGGPTSSFDMVAFETANRIASAEIQMESDKQISSLLDTAQKTGMSIADVSSGLADITDGYAATLSTLDPEAAGLLRVRIGEASGQAIQRYGSYVESKAKAARSARIEASIDLYASNLMKSAVLPGATATTLNEQAQKDAALLISAGVDPDKAAAAAAAALKDAVIENLSYRAVNVPISELRDVTKAPPTEPLVGLTMTETLSAWNKVSTIYSARTDSLRVEAAAVNDQIKSANRVLETGGMPGPVQIADLGEKVQMLAEYEPSLLAKFADLKDDATYVAGVRNMNIDQLNAEVERVSAGIVGMGEDRVVDGKIVPLLDTPDEIQMLAFATQTRDAAKRVIDLAAADADRLSARTASLIGGAENAISRAEEEALRADKEASAGPKAEISKWIDVLGYQLEQQNPNHAVTSMAIQNISDLVPKIAASQMTADIVVAAEQIKLINSDFASWKGRLPEDQIATIASLMNDIPANVPAGMTTADMLLVNANRAKLLQGLQKNQTDAADRGDILSWAATTGFVIPAGINGPAHPAAQPLNFLGTPEDLAKSFAQRINDIAILETRFQVSDQNIFLPREKAYFISALEAGNVGEKLGIITAIVSNAGPQTERLLKEIGAENSIYANIGGLVAGGRIETAQKIIYGMTVAQPKSLGTDRMNVANAFFGGSMYAMPKYKESVIASADALYAEDNSRNDDGGVFDSDKYTEFLKQSLGNMTMSNDFGDVPALVPLGLGTDWLKKLILDGSTVEGARAGVALKDEKAASQQYAVSFWQNFVINKDDLADFPTNALPGLEWYPVNIGQRDGKTAYVLRHGSGANFEDWESTNGVPILFDLSKMPGVAK